MRIATWVIAGALMPVYACDETSGASGGSPGPFTPATAAAIESACGAVEDCEGEERRMECDLIFDTFALPAQCVEEIETATCAEHAESVPPYTDSCFPPCRNTPQRCNDDGTLTMCDALLGRSRLVRAKCETVCREQGFTFVSCGRRYEEQTADEEKCWCDVDESGSNADAGAPPEEIPPGVSVRLSEAADVMPACAALEACDESCVYLTENLVTEACVQAVVAAQCEDRDPSYEDICFPPCPYEQTEYCNEDGQSTRCDYYGGVLRWFTRSCEQHCEVSRLGPPTGACVFGVCDCELPPELIEP